LNYPRYWDKWFCSKQDRHHHKRTFRGARSCEGFTDL